MISPRQRLRQWWRSRLKPVEQWTLTQRNIYIVPSRAGLAFVFTLLLLLLASINYQLNLGYALTFLLAGSALASMHMTHASLRGLSLHVKPPLPAFAGGRAELELLITNPGGSRYGLGFGLEDLPQQLSWVAVPAQTQTAVVIGCTALRRGRQGLPLLRAESRFPFGLFRAWTVWQPAGTLWVYPALETPTPALPPPEAMAGGQPHSHASRAGEFDGVRPWRSGDSLRQIVWKKVARGGGLVSREHQDSTQLRLCLDWQLTGLVEPEARLSRLAAWVVLADSRGLDYSLRLPGRELGSGSGSLHQHEALRRLAEWTA